jgi:hypothetical protein
VRGIPALDQLFPDRKSGIRTPDELIPDLEGANRLTPAGNPRCRQLLALLLDNSGDGEGNVQRAFLLRCSD